LQLQSGDEWRREQAITVLGEAIVGSGERRLPACMSRQLAGDPSDSFRLAAEMCRLAACAPQILQHATRGIHPRAFVYSVVNFSPHEQSLP
jgi:hypothetical protein